MPRSTTAKSDDSCMFSCFPEWLCHCPFLSAITYKLYSLSTFGVVSISYFSLSDRCVVISYCGLICISLMANSVELKIHPVKMYVDTFCPYSNWIFFVVEFWEFFTYRRCESFCQIYDLQIVLIFDGVQFIVFFLLWIVLVSCLPFTWPYVLVKIFTCFLLKVF